MSYKISSIPLFDKQAKRLAKKYPSLKNDLVQLVESLINEPMVTIFTRYALPLQVKAKASKSQLMN